MRTGQNIYKRRDGRWEARVPLGKKADGRPHFKYPAYFVQWYSSGGTLCTDLGGY